MEIKKVTVQEAVDLLKNNNNIQLLDTRTFAEVRATGFIKGSMLIDTSLPTLEEEILKLDRNKEYLLY